MRIFRSESLDAGAPDISWSNKTVPIFPNGLSLWGRIVCLLGYHMPQARRTGPNHRGGDGSLMDFKLRDQCGRCGTLL